MDPAVNGGAAATRLRRSRETTPERIRASQPAKPKPLRKVQIVYYLSRNGQLEHPHFIEIAQNPNQQLRLKDVMDRMIFLRGKGMPCLFSWSCKRSYKNGYVWNDLAENDVVLPADGAAEYILKGSEIIESCSEGFRRLQLAGGHGGEDPDEEETEEEKPWRSQQTSRRLSRSRPSELVLDDGDVSPPSSSSSEKAHPPAAAVPRRRTVAAALARYESGDPAEEHTLQQQPRSSVLLQLIACGSSAAAKGRSGVNKTAAAASAARSVFNSGRKSAAALHKEVLCRAAAAVEDEDVEDINHMPLNPNPRREEKEYFSGSIVESFTEMSRAVAGPCLKKSSSYNEERSVKCGLGEVYEKSVAAARKETAAEGEEKGERGGAAKCIPSGRKKTAGGAEYGSKTAVKASR